MAEHRFLTDITNEFWGFVREAHNYNTGDEVKQLQSFEKLKDAVKYENEGGLLFIKDNSIFPPCNADIELPEHMQKVILPPYGDCIYVFPDIHEVFHGIKYLVTVNGNEKATIEIGKCILLMENYIDTKKIQTQLQKQMKKLNI